MKERLIERLRNCRKQYEKAVAEKNWGEANFWDGRASAYCDTLFDFFDWTEGEEG